jgi:hypothetical protein
VAIENKINTMLNIWRYIRTGIWEHNAALVPIYYDGETYYVWYHELITLRETFPEIFCKINNIMHARICRDTFEVRKMLPDGKCIRNVYRWDYDSEIWIRQRNLDLIY